MFEEIPSPPVPPSQRTAVVTFGIFLAVFLISPAIAWFRWLTGLARCKACDGTLTAGAEYFATRPRMSGGEVDEGALFRALFESVADAILVVDGSGQIVLANAACGSLLGYPPTSLRGRSVGTLVPPRFGEHG